MLIKLTDFEMRLARHLGKARQTANQVVGSTDMQQGNQNSTDIHVQGVAAEIAFCKAMNLYPDFELGVWADADATLPCGATVDVKHTTRDNGRLLAIKSKENKPADLYVLVTGLPPALTIRGGMRAELLFQESNVRDLGHGPTFAVDQVDLWEIADLIWVFEYETWKPPTRDDARDSDRPGVHRGDKRIAFGLNRSPG